MATQRKADFPCTDEEWKLRQDLAACYRIFDHLGWGESIYNHISVKIPGEDDTFLINPFGLMYDEVTASNLVKIDVEGNNVGPSQYPVNKAGFTQHRQRHAAHHKYPGQPQHDEDDDRRQRIGQQMAQDDAPIRNTNGTRRQNEIRLAQGQYLPSHQPRQSPPAQDRQN